MTLLASLTLQLPLPLLVLMLTVPVYPGIKALLASSAAIVIAFGRQVLALVVAGVMRK